MELNKILEELQHYKNPNKQEVFAQLVQERLTQSLRSYYKELNNSLTYLYGRDDLKVVKKLNDYE